MLNKTTNFTIDLEKEEDGRWIAEVHQIPGVICYGENREEAVTKAEALALRAYADQIETGETTSNLASLVFNFA